MSGRLLVIIFLLLPITLACSVADKLAGIPQGEAVLEPDCGYVFLLEEQSLDESAPGGGPVTEHILIHGGKARHFADKRSPSISRDGHFAACDNFSQIVLFYPGEADHFTMKLSDDERQGFLIGGFGLSPSGKRLYRAMINQVRAGDGSLFRGELIEFNLDYKRDTAITTFFETDYRTFDRSPQPYTQGISLPLIISESGSRVIFRSLDIAGEPDSDLLAEDEGWPEGVMSYSYTGPPYDFFIFDKDGGISHMLYQSSKSGYSDFKFAATSARGDKVLYFAGLPDGSTEILLQKNIESPPEVVVTGKSGEVRNPRLSREGGSLAYFRKKRAPDVDTTDAVVMHITSRREDVPVRLGDISDAYWSDELKVIAYISNSNRSSVILAGKPKLTGDGAYYLHLVDVETRKDTVVYCGRDGYKLVLIEVLAVAQGFGDESEGGPEAFGAPVIGEKGQSGSSSRRKGSRVKGKSPSISSD